MRDADDEDGVEEGGGDLEAVAEQGDGGGGGGGQRGGRRRAAQRKQGDADQGARGGGGDARRQGLDAEGGQRERDEDGGQLVEEGGSRGVRVGEACDLGDVCGEHECAELEAGRDVARQRAGAQAWERARGRAEVADQDGQEEERGHDEAQGVEGGRREGDGEQIEQLRARDEGRSQQRDQHGGRRV